MNRTLLATFLFLSSANALAGYPAVIISTDQGLQFEKASLKSDAKVLDLGGFHSKEWELLTVGDIDNDNIADYVFKHRFTGELRILPNPKFSERKAYSLGVTLNSAMSVDLADVDGDAAADLIIKDAKNNNVLVVAPVAEGAPATVWFTPKEPVNTLQFSQIDGDAKADAMALTDTGAALYLSATQGANHREVAVLYRFDAPLKNDNSLFEPVFFDINSDGKKDLIFKTRDGQWAPYSMFSGADGYTGLLKDSEPFYAGKYANIVGAFDVDGDGASELLTFDAGLNEISVFSKKSSEDKDARTQPLPMWQFVDRFKVYGIEGRITDIRIIPTLDLTWFLSRYVGVDQINEHVNPLIVSNLVDYDSFLSLEERAKAPIFPYSGGVFTPLQEHYRADFGVDITVDQFAFSATPSVNVTSASFKKLEPDANGILRPTGSDIAATVAHNTISAVLPLGNYRLRVINQAATADIVTLNRYVPQSLQLEKSRLYPYVDDPVARPAKNHYLTRKDGVVTDADDYYNRVAFFKGQADLEGRGANFNDWFTFNKISNKKVMNAVYINSGDLGFARNMFITQKDSNGRVFAWVENYATLPEAVAASQSYKAVYNTFVPSPLAVIGNIAIAPYLYSDAIYVSLIDAKIADLIVPANIRDLLNPRGVNRKGLIATVAMEYHPAGSSAGRLVSFFVFDNNSHLSKIANLDGRGAKQNPSVCMACHGSTNAMASNGDVGAGFIPWDLDSYIFSNTAGYTRSAQLGSFWGMNAVVKSMYASTDPVNQLVSAWYPFTFPLYKQKEFVGDNVMPASFAAAGKQNLYRDVLAPNCRMCHLQPGVFNALASDQSTFSSMLSFKLEHTLNKADDNRYAPDMPQAYLTFKSLWNRGAMQTVKTEIGH